MFFSNDRHENKLQAFLDGVCKKPALNGLIKKANGESLKTMCPEKRQQLILIVNIEICDVKF